jgi:hypothetical protein
MYELMGRVRYTFFGTAYAFNAWLLFNMAAERGYLHPYAELTSC